MLGLNKQFQTHIKWLLYMNYITIESLNIELMSFKKNIQLIVSCSSLLIQF